MKKNKKGYSLIELIVVIAIIAILVGIAAPVTINLVNKANVSADKATAEAIKNGIAIHVAEEAVAGTSTDVNATNLNGIIEEHVDGVNLTPRQGGMAYYYSRETGEVIVDKAAEPDTAKADILDENDESIWIKITVSSESGESGTGS